MTQPQSRFTADNYSTPPRRLGWLARTWPSLVFYVKVFNIVYRSSRLARRGVYDEAAWCASSVDVMDALEAVGCRLEVTGLDQIDRLDRAAIFIGNHMSTLETFVLPGLIVPRRKQLTYVVKRSLTEYPIFRHVMRSRNPVLVDRVNPRDDLKAVLEQGAERLAAGTSIVIFPQHTRTAEFDPEQFNSIGIKLAARTGAPVVPVALQTWAWSTGRLHKDYGPIIPSRPVRFAFGEPFTVEGKGQAEHQRVVSFIQEQIAQWQNMTANS